MGKPVIMGRGTFDAMGMPLDGRYNIVMSRDKNLTIEGAIVVGNIEEALDEARAQQCDEAVVIGGAQIYREALAFTEVLYLTVVYGTFEGDVSIDIDFSQWELIAREDHMSTTEGEHSYSFLDYRRLPQFLRL